MYEISLSEEEKKNFGELWKSFSLCTYEEKNLNYITILKLKKDLEKQHDNLKTEHDNLKTEDDNLKKVCMHCKECGKTYNKK